VNGPWQLSDTVRRTQGHLLATVALGVSWYGAASTTAGGRQVVFVAVGVAAVAVMGAAESLWLLGGLRVVRDRRAALHLDLAEACRPEVAVAVSTELVVVPGGTLAHHAQCPAVQGKQQTRARRGLRPCPLCRTP